MSKSLFLLFNHQLTSEQENDARDSLKISNIQSLPLELKAFWRQIPPHLPAITQFLQPIRTWLAAQAQPDDYVLIQGDFGACFLMVNFAFKNKLIPIYSTTVRKAVEEIAEDGSIKLIHRFKHQIFRKYNQ